jgi:hypothetical protein
VGMEVKKVLIWFTFIFFFSRGKAID